MAEVNRILFMRHPQTVANVQHFLSGRKNVDLTPEGERQMFRAIDAIEAWRPDRILTSPLARCKAIGEEAADRLGISCVIMDDLAEIEFGSAQGLTVAQLRTQGYDFPWSRDEEGHSLPAPGAESFEDLMGRATGVLGELSQLSGRTACLTHGGFTRALVGAALHIPLETFWNLMLPNVSSQVLSWDGGRYTLAALGLSPEEVKLRAEHPELLGMDTTVTMERGE